MPIDDIARELDLWAEAGRVARFWWRDDDAIAPTPALAKLIELSEAHRIEVALAVIPALAAEALPDALLEREHIAVLQHGYAHKNHAASNSKSVECGGERPTAQVLAELAEGGRLLKKLFGPRAESILAVPWNRIERRVLDRLSEAGFRGASAYGPRARMSGAPGLVIANAHVDPMNWRQRRFAGDEKAVSAVLGELRARRTKKVEADEPLGLLTHHLDHDGPFWSFLERLFRVTIAHPAARWITVAEAFAEAPGHPAAAMPVR